MPLRVWVHVRTVLSIGGIAFALTELVGACLDHVGEIPRCEAGADAGADCGAGAATAPPTTGSGSGSGSAAP